MRTGSTHQEQNQKEEASYKGYNKLEGLMLQRQGSEERSNIYGQFKNARPTQVSEAWVHLPGRTRRGQATKRTVQNKKEGLKKQEMNYVNLPRAQQDVWIKLLGAGPEEWTDHQEKIKNTRLNLREQDEDCVKRPGTGQEFSS